MQVKVKLQAYLDKYAPPSANGNDSFPLDLPDGATVRDLLKALQISLEEASVIAVNDQDMPLSGVLQNGDDVIVIPPLAGG